MCICDHSWMCDIFCKTVYSNVSMLFRGYVVLLRETYPSPWNLAHLSLLHRAGVQGLGQEEV